MKKLIKYLYQSYILYTYELKGITYTKDYHKPTNQYFGSIYNLNNNIRVDISRNVKSNELFREILIEEIKKII